MFRLNQMQKYLCRCEEGVLPDEAISSLKLGDCFGQSTLAATYSSEFVRVLTFAELPQLEMNFAPLDFRDAHFLSNLVSLHACSKIAQDARPAAHVE